MSQKNDEKCSKSKISKNGTIRVSVTKYYFITQRYPNLHYK